MAYRVYYLCDKCGAGHSWTNYTVSYGRAVRLARADGWKVGKKGWYCPKCKAKPQKEKQEC